jgi:hypothetical protein
MNGGWSATEHLCVKNENERRVCRPANWDGTCNSDHSLCSATDVGSGTCADTNTGKWAGGKKCRRKLRKNKCHKKKTRKNCAYTCGVCFG